MMMPANYSVIAENEMTYVGGGFDLLSFLGDNLPEVIHNTKTLTTNLVNIVANTFVAPVVSSTLGIMFSGEWGVNNNTIGNAWTTAFYKKGDILNTAMGVVGNLAAVYQLATVPVKTYTKETIVGVTGLKV